MSTQIIDTKYRLHHDPYFRCLYETIRQYIKAKKVTPKEIYKILNMIEKDLYREALENEDIHLMEMLQENKK